MAKQTRGTFRSAKFRLDQSNGVDENPENAKLSK